MSSRARGSSPLSCQSFLRDGGAQGSFPARQKVDILAALPHCGNLPSHRGHPAGVRRTPRPGTNDEALPGQARQHQRDHRLRRRPRDDQQDPPRGQRARQRRTGRERLGAAGRRRSRRADARKISPVPPNSAPRSSSSAPAAASASRSRSCCAGSSRRASASSSWISRPPAAPTTSSWPRAARWWSDCCTNVEPRNAAVTPPQYALHPGGRFRLPCDTRTACAGAFAMIAQHHRPTNRRPD
jgi:hypothetical protein